MRLGLLILLSALGAPLAADDGADAIVGTWYVESKRGDAHITIDREWNEYTGRITWLAEPNWPPDDELGMAGQPKTDRANPDPELRGRPILGLRILEGLEYDGDGVWTGGRIYAADEGKTYRCKAKLEDPGTLKFRGFIGFSLLGRSIEWTRVHPDDIDAADGNGQ